MSDRDRFSGDMSRNEVEIDLSKFMEMVTENNELKQKIFELEHDDKKTHIRNGYTLQEVLMHGEYASCILKCVHFLNLLRGNVVYRFTSTDYGTVWSYQYSGRERRLVWTIC